MRPSWEWYTAIMDRVELLVSGTELERILDRLAEAITQVLAERDPYGAVRHERRGHRRRLAAATAGVSPYPTTMSTPPATGGPPAAGTSNGCIGPRPPCTDGMCW